MKFDSLFILFRPYVIWHSRLPRLWTVLEQWRERMLFLFLTVCMCVCVWVRGKITFALKSSSILRQFHDWQHYYAQVHSMSVESGEWIPALWLVAMRYFVVCNLKRLYNSDLQKLNSSDKFVIVNSYRLMTFNLINI